MEMTKETSAWALDRVEGLSRVTVVVSFMYILSFIRQSIRVGTTTGRAVVKVCLEEVESLVGSNIYGRLENIWLSCRTFHQ